MGVQVEQLQTGLWGLGGPMVNPGYLMAGSQGGGGLAGLLGSPLTLGASTKVRLLLYLGLDNFHSS